MEGVYHTGELAGFMAGGQIELPKILGGAILYGSVSVRRPGEGREVVLAGGLISQERCFYTS